MRMTFILSIIKASILSIVFVALSAPGFADDADLKKQIEQIGSAYVESFNRQDAAGLAALYATGGIYVGQAGARTDLVQMYEGTFKAGINQAEVKVDQVWPLGSDTALGMGSPGYRQEPERSSHRTRGALDRHVCPGGWKIESPDADGNSGAAPREMIWPAR